MKNSYLSTIILAVTIILFTSCEQKQISTYVPQVLTGEEYLDNYLTPTVLYSFLQMDEETKAVTGWLINNEGRIFDINLDKNPIELFESEISAIDMGSFLGNGVNTGATVDLDELVSYYKKTRDLNYAEFSFDTEASNLNSTTYILAYDLSYEDQECDSCYSQGSSMTEFRQYLLKAEGAVNGQIPGNLTREIATWLKDLNSGL